MSTEEFVIQVVADANGAIKGLSAIDKTGKETSRTFKSVGDSARKSHARLVKAFTSLAGKLAGLMTVAGFVRFVKNLAEAQLRLRNMSQSMGQSMKSLRALQMAFKSFGYSMSGADASVEAFTKSVADFKYGGELGGQAEAFSKLNVAIMDASGNTRDYYEVLVEGGEQALRAMGGDSQKAGEFLRHLNFTQEQITIMLDKNARANMNKNKELSATSEDTANKLEQMNQKIIALKEKFSSFVLMIAEKLRIFEILNSLLVAISDWCSGEPSKATLGFFSMLYEILDGIETLVIVLINLGKKFQDYVLQPVSKFLDLIGQYVDNANGGNYKSTGSWFGDGKDVYTKSYDGNGNVTRRNFYTPLDGSYGFVSGKSSGATGGGYSYAQEETGSGVGGGVGSDANSSLWNYFRANEGRGYKFDGANAYNCSIFTAQAFDKMIKENGDKFDQSDRKLFRGTSEQQIDAVAKRTGGFLDASALSDENIKGGLLIGIDTGNHGWDRGRKRGIDHILMTVEEDGRVWVVDNSGRRGVGRQTPEQFRRYARAGGKVQGLYIVDTGRLAKNNSSAEQYHQVAKAKTNTGSMESVPIKTVNITNNTDSRMNVYTNGGMNRIHSATATARA